MRPFPHALTPTQPGAAALPDALVRLALASVQEFEQALDRPGLDPTSRRILEQELKIARHELHLARAGSTTPCTTGAR